MQESTSDDCKPDMTPMIDVVFQLLIFFLVSIGVLLGTLVDRSDPDLGGLSYLEFVAPGLVAVTAMQTAASVTTFPVKAGLKWLRTYHAVVATPVKVRELVAGVTGVFGLKRGERFEFGYVPASSPHAPILPPSADRGFHIHDVSRHESERSASRGMRFAFVAAGVRRAPRFTMMLTARSITFSKRDRELWKSAELREGFAENLRQAFVQGTRGIDEDLRLYTQRWDFALEDVRAPVYWWHGEDDRIVPVRHVREEIVALPDVRVTYYPGEGHFMVLEHVDEVLRVVAGLRANASPA